MSSSIGIIKLIHELVRVDSVVVELVGLSCDRRAIELMLQVRIQIILHCGRIQVERFIQSTELVLGEHV